MLRSRRWLGFLALAAAFAVAAVLLGRWQWHRHEDRVANADRVNAHYDAPPVPLASVLASPDSPMTQAQEWRRVTATGQYRPDSLLLVRNRPHEGVYGYEVLVPLDLTGGGTLLVNRGWVPNAESAATVPDVPATPSGTVTVTGWLRPGEPDLGRDLPPGQLASVNLADARAQIGTDLYDAYLVRGAEVGTAGQPIEAPAALERPDTDLGPHLAYAVQWWLAVPAGFVLEFFGVRREWRDGVAGAVAGEGEPVPAARPRKVRVWDEEDG